MERCPSFDQADGYSAAQMGSPIAPNKSEAWRNGYEDFGRDQGQVVYLPNEPNPNNSDGLSDNDLRARYAFEHQYSAQW